jgi:alpha-glucoside transport system permease protein
MSTATAPPPRTATAPEEGPREGVGSRIVGVLTKAPVQVVLILIALVWLVPTIGLFLTSLLSAEDASDNGWWKIFADPSLATFDNYQAIFENDDITSSLTTTAIIAVGGTVLPIFIGALAAYAFAWLEFPGRDWIFIAVIGMLVVPIQMALIPMFSLYNDLGIFDTALSLILFHTAFGLPFAIFLLRNFFIGIPKELLEAARLDGASEWRIFMRVVLPLGMPAIAALAVFQFIWTWNDLIVALTLARDTQPITVAIFSELRQFGSNIDLIAPASFVSLAIPLAMFFAFQRYFVQGLLAGAVK